MRRNCGTTRKDCEPNTFIDTLLAAYEAGRGRRGDHGVSGTRVRATRSHAWHVNKKLCDVIVTCMVLPLTCTSDSAKVLDERFQHLIDPRDAVLKAPAH